MKCFKGFALSSRKVLEKLGGVRVQAHQVLAEVHVEVFEELGEVRAQPYQELAEVGV